MMRKEVSIKSTTKTVNGKICWRCGGTLRYRVRNVCIKCSRDAQIAYRKGTKLGKKPLKYKNRYDTVEYNREKARAWSRANPDIVRQRNVAFRATIRGRAVYLVKVAQIRASKYGVIFNLDIASIEDKLKTGICEVTGITLDLSTGSGTRGPWGPSLDRLSSAKGYTAKNVRLVCNMYNLAKSSFTEDDVLTMADALVKRYR